MGDSCNSKSWAVPSTYEYHFGLWYADANVDQTP